MQGRRGWTVAWVLMGFVVSACGHGPEGPSREDGAYRAPARDAQFLTATQTYGPLYVKEGDLEAYSVTHPWSSYWFPKKDPILFQPRNGQPAPLQKYDKYLGSGQAAPYEESHWDPAGADTWDGLCDAWSAASVLEPEPSHGATVDGIKFSVLDLKALLIKSYEDAGSRKKIFGQRYSREGRDDYQDILPDQFHRVVQAELVEHGRAIVIDKDPGLEVWNTPVSGIVATLTRDRVDRHVMHVEANIQGASPSFDDVSYVGTNDFWLQYTYDLFGNDQADGTFKVEYGAWTGKSVDYHPDFVVAFPDPDGLRKNRRSFNPGIDTAKVDEILAKARSAPAE